MTKFKWILASALLAAPSLFAQVDFTLMTWPEVKQALADGKTTALILNGGIQFGNAVVAPVIPFSLNHANPAPPGTIGISNEVFAQFNEEVAEQMITNGFKNIVLLGNHGGGHSQLDQVAKELTDKYADKGIRVVHCNEFYDKVGVDFDKWLADNGYPAGSHASVKDTSELLYLGDARRSTPEIGKRVSDMKVDYAVDQIQGLLK